MKKIVVMGLMSFLISSSTLCSIEESKKELQFTENDYIKTGAAAFGTLFFTAAAFRAPACNHFASVMVRNDVVTWFDLPANIMGALLYWRLKSLKAINFGLHEEFCDIVFGLSGLISGVLAGICGSYVCQKLYQLKQVTSSKESVAQAK